ncbi:hypothetical protein DFJ74DRAFT_685550 [Hyaloraphidium curvatum]|nr:hypothetical protein DFJ74DRAFT_685550 [Hyaloraphidium curvatum]
MSPAVGPPFARGPPPRAFAPPDDDDATATETETDADLAARSEWGGRDRADPMARSIAPLRRATSADGRRGAPVPVARHPALLPFVLTPPNADDDPKLLPSAAPAFVAAFLSVIPPGSAVELRTTFLEAHAHYSGAPWPHADPRWRRFYLHPLFVCVVHWVGARVLRDRGDPGDRQYSSEFTVAEVVDRHEKRFERLLREELDRFWDEAEQAQEEGDLKALHTEENLALQWALGIGMTFVSMQMQRPAAARAFIRHCIAIWRAMRVPGEDGFEPEISGLDDFLVYHSWVAIFWIVTMFELWVHPGPPAADPNSDPPAPPGQLPGRAHADPNPLRPRPGIPHRPLPPPRAHPDAAPPALAAHPELRDPHGPPAPGPQVPRHRVHRLAGPDHGGRRRPARAGHRPAQLRHQAARVGGDALHRAAAVRRAQDPGVLDLAQGRRRAAADRRAGGGGAHPPRAGRRGRRRGGGARVRGLGAGQPAAQGSRAAARLPAGLAGPDREQAAARGGRRRAGVGCREGLRGGVVPRAAGAAAAAGAPDHDAAAGDAALVPRRVRGRRG